MPRRRRKVTSKGIITAVWHKLWAGITSKSSPQNKTGSRSVYYRLFMGFMLSCVLRETVEGLVGNRTSLQGNSFFFQFQRKKSNMLQREGASLSQHCLLTGLEWAALWAVGHSESVVSDTAKTILTANNVTQPKLETVQDRQIENIRKEMAWVLSECLCEGPLEQLPSAVMWLTRVKWLIELATTWWTCWNDSLKVSG